MKCHATHAPLHEEVEAYQFNIDELSNKLAQKKKPGTTAEHTPYKDLAYLETELTQASARFEKIKDISLTIAQRAKINEAEGQT